MRIELDKKDIVRAVEKYYKNINNTNTIAALEPYPPPYPYPPPLYPYIGYVYPPEYELLHPQPHPLLLFPEYPP